MTLVLYNTDNRITTLFIIYNKTYLCRTRINRRLKESETSLSVSLNLFGDMRGCVPHYENTPIQIFRKFHFQKLKCFR